MKKWVLVAASGFFMVNAQADKAFCGYNDYFHLNVPAQPTLHIISGNGDKDVSFQKIGEQSFVVGDDSNCKPGFAHVIVGYDDTHQCVLDIKDGPYMWSPLVMASCTGIRYTDTTYDGFNTYSYSINLN